MMQLSLLVGLVALAPAGDPAIVSARVATGPPHHVGQAIEIHVGVAGPSGRPKVEPPRLANADVREIGPGDGGPITRFVIVPRGSGSLEIPPFRARVGDRTAASKPIRLTVAGVPVSGRPPAFLGGVGTFEVRAEAEPTSVRAGQALEYRLTVAGPAAWGSLRAPDLSAWAALTPRFRVEALAPGEVVGEPPSRTFRYRLRPMAGGRVALPPVAVAAFDPKTRTFVTRYSPGVPVTVEAPTPLDPSRVQFGADEGSEGFGPWRVGLGVIIIVAGSSLIALTRLVRRAKSAREVDPAAELAGGLGTLEGGTAEAGRAAEALATFLERAGGRPPGVLTPPEAREHFERLTRDSELAGRAGRLIDRCDRARYGGPTASAVGRLGDEAREILLEAGTKIQAGGWREAESEGGSRGRAILGRSGRQLPPAVIKGPSGTLQVGGGSLSEPPGR